MKYFRMNELAPCFDKNEARCRECRLKQPANKLPDGVEEIEEFAFLSCRNYLELSIPRSVRKIGDTIFGKGGIIVVRDK